jgi:hypothetical protein
MPKMFYICFFNCRLIADNIDHEINARVQTKDNKNRSIHWTHQYAVLDRVHDPTLDRKKSQKPTSSIDFVEILPDQQVQAHLMENFAVLISRVITKYLKHFQPLRNLVVRHVPHQFEKQSATKSNIVSTSIALLPGV